MVKRKGSSRKERTNKLGKYLTKIRLSRRETQLDVAKRIDKSRCFICRIERGQRRDKCLRGFILYQLAKAYKADINLVLKKAKWPQLLLLDCDKEEKQNLIRYIKDNL